MQNENPLPVIPSAVEDPTAKSSRSLYGVPRLRSGWRAITRPRSTPVALYNNHKKGKPCARAPCCHTAHICLIVAHANDWPLCAYAAASWKFYVWGHPYQAAMKARYCRKTTSRLRKEIR